MIELSWTTFFLEIINFLVLLWILKHFLYKPVLAGIARRKQKVDAMIATAQQSNEEAESLREEYQARLAQWEKDKSRAEEKLHAELQEKRNTSLARLDADLAREREKTDVLERQRRDGLELQRRLEALKVGARFSARLLESLATPELEKTIVTQVIEQLARLPEHQADLLRNGCEALPDSIAVSSAYALDEDQKSALTGALQRYCPASAAIEFDVDRTLVAGLQIVAGASVLKMNIRDELDGFAELGEHE